ncbi:MAG: tRNA-dihydrouridine synthase family protein [Candidatus Woesearchaeota archaeon]
MVRLGRLRLQNPFLLAPIAGYSDTCLRQICHDYGCAYAFTELIPTAAFIRKPDLKMYDFFDPVGLQFITNNPEELRKCIEIVNNKKRPLMENIKSIDLNLGCPDKKMIEQNMGSALLNQPKLVRELFRTMRTCSNIPVSAKLRLAINSKHKKTKPYLRIARIAKEEGLDFLTIHARTAGQGYSGEVDLAAIKEVHDSVDIPLVGNGNVIDEETAMRMLEISDAVMIGRHAMKEPFVFRQLNHFLEHKKKLGLDMQEEKMLCIRNYMALAEKHDVGFQHIKIHLQSFLKGTRHKGTIMDLTHARTLDQLRDMISVVVDFSK